MAIFYRGAYRGVPFTIESDDDAPWDLVNPEERLDHSGVFLGFNLDLGSYHHINYDLQHKDFAEKTLYTVIEARMETVLKNAEKSMGSAAWREEVLELYGTETGRERIIEELNEAIEKCDMETITRLLTFAEVDYIQKDVRGHSQGELTKTLYFDSAGEDITPETRQQYEILFNEISNWINGNCYTAVIGSDRCSGFIDELAPQYSQKGHIFEHIHIEIDELLNNAKGDYLVTGDYAEIDEKTNRLIFDAGRPVEIRVDSLEAAKEITGMFGGHAVFTKN